MLKSVESELCLPQVTGVAHRHRIGLTLHEMFEREELVTTGISKMLKLLQHFIELYKDSLINHSSHFCYNVTPSSRGPQMIRRTLPMFQRRFQFMLKSALELIVHNSIVRECRKTVVYKFLQFYCTEFVRNSHLDSVKTGQHTTTGPQYVFNIWEKFKNSCQKEEFFIQMRENSSENKSANDAKNMHTLGYFLPLIKQEIKKEHQKTKRQFAYALVIFEYGYEKINPVYPKYKDSKHSEEILIDLLDNFLYIRKTEIVKFILIYTYNSPCLMRKDTECCMQKLLYKSYEWEQNGILTLVVYSKSYGLTGPNYFRSLTFSKILGPCSYFYPYIGKCKRDPLKLNLKGFTKNFHNVYHAIKDVNGKKQKAECRKMIELATNTFMRHAEKWICPRDEHLRRGKKTITNVFNFLPDKLIEELFDKFVEMVNSSAMVPIREQITADYNNNAVQCFQNLLEKNSPLQLMQIF